MTAIEAVVTVKPVAGLPGALPLRPRRVVRTVWYFYCWECGREDQFSWHHAFCTDTGRLLCILCTPARNYDKDRTGYKVCRRCRRPRRVGRDTQFTWLGPHLPPSYVGYPDHNTICDDCRRTVPKRREPLRAACSHCGAGFTAKRADARFCSGRCRTAAHRGDQR